MVRLWGNKKIERLRGKNRIERLQGNNKYCIYTMIDCNLCREYRESYSKDLILFDGSFTMNSDRTNVNISAGHLYKADSSGCVEVCRPS